MSAPAGQQHVSSSTYVFRLNNFDENGSKVAKRKYGYTSSKPDGADLDRTVYDGIVTRAEQVFSLKPGSYEILLIAKAGAGTGSSENPKELGETELAGNLGKAIRIDSYEKFKDLRKSMTSLEPDVKKRKVVNLCIRPIKVTSISTSATSTLPTSKPAPQQASSPVVNKLGSASAETAPATASTAAAGPQAQICSVPTKADVEALRASFKVYKDALRVYKDTIPRVSRAGEPVDVTQEARAQLQAAISACLKTLGPAPTAGRSPEGASTPLKMPGAMPGTTDPADIDIGKPHQAPAASVRTPPATQSQVAAPTTSSQVPAATPKVPPSPASLNKSEAPVFGRTGFAEYAQKSPAGFTWAGGPSSARRDHTKANGAWPHRGYAVTAGVRREALDAGLRSIRAAREAGKTCESGSISADTSPAKPLPSSFSDFFGDNRPVRSGSSAESSSGTAPRGGPSPRSTTMPICGTALLRGAAGTDSPSASADKFESLRNSLEKLVVDFNDTLADVFGATQVARGATPTAKQPEKTIYEGSGEKAGASGPAEAESKPEEKPKHKATCDICQEWIHGLRYKCMDCPDWDCCEKCFARREESHPGHTVVTVRQPGDIVTSKIRNMGGYARFDNDRSVYHAGYHCDSCNKPIYGVRYKCTHSACPDFDLCAECEADPVSYAVGRQIGAHYFDSHHLLKIRKPLQRFAGSISAPASQYLSQIIANARNFQPAPAANSAAQPMATQGAVSSLSGPGDKTLIVDVQLPFALANGQQEIPITLELGKNEKGETVVLGPAAAADVAPAAAVKPVDPPVAISAAPSIALATHSASARPDATGCTEGPSVPASELEAVADPEPAALDAAPQTLAAEDVKEVLNASWVEDVTFEDGTSVAPGTVFNKIWRVKNSGNKAWPVGTALVCVSGQGRIGAKDKIVACELPSTAAGEIIEVIAKDIVAPDVPGKFMAYYRFVTPVGNRFGDRLWIDLDIEEHESEISKSTSGSDTSLRSSSVITPKLSVVNARADPNDEGEHAVSALTSPRTTESDLPDLETISATDVTNMTERADDEDEDDDGFVLLSDEDDEDHFAELESVGSSKN